MVGKLLLFISLHPLPGGHCLGNSGYILCADQSRNHTARELAERFQVSETSLKNYFGTCSGKISLYSCGRRGFDRWWSCFGTR